MQFLLVLFLTRSISAFVASLNFDLIFSCHWLNLLSKSFSSFRFCLALFLAKTIVDALISILIISQNKPLSLRLQYLEMNFGNCFAIISLSHLSVNNELLRVIVSKNQRNGGHSQKIDFAHTLSV